MTKDYVSMVYDEKRTPKTDYPLKLAAYLFERFGMKRGEKLLELGCGRGEFLEAFQDLGLDCRGVDISDYGSKHNQKLHISCSDISKDKLPLEDSSVDYVYHKSLIEHLNSADHLMKETYRVLKPGGRVIILTPDWVSQMKVFYEDYTHSRPYDINSLRDLLTVNDFREVETEIFYQLPVLWEHPYMKIFSRLLQFILSTPNARKITQVTGLKYFRWSVELMVLGTGIKGNLQ